MSTKGEKKVWSKKAYALRKRAQKLKGTWGQKLTPEFVTDFFHFWVIKRKSTRDKITALHPD